MCPPMCNLAPQILVVAGKDVLLEHQGDGYYEPLDLGIARCKLMTAVPVGAPTQTGSPPGGHQVY